MRYVAVDDCGKAINPLLIDGQVHGGIVHAIGQALYERVHYDEDGQLVTGTFVDYALPTAAELPSFETDRTVTPSPVNSLGAKGIGEAGTIAASAAVTNAVIDALRPLGVTYINMPLSPMRVWEAIAEAKGASPEGGVPHDPGRVRLRGARHARGRDQGGDRRRRGRQAAGRRALADPADEAAPGDAFAAGRPAQGAGTARHPARERQLADRRADGAHASWSTRPSWGSLSVAAGTIADPQVRNRGTIGGSLVARRPGLRPPGGAADHRGRGDADRGRAASAPSRPRTCSATTSRRPSSTARC